MTIRGTLSISLDGTRLMVWATCGAVFYGLNNLAVALVYAMFAMRLVSRTYENFTALYLNFASNALCHVISSSHACRNTLHTRKFPYSHIRVSSFCSRHKLSCDRALLSCFNLYKYFVPVASFPVRYVQTFQEVSLVLGHYCWARFF